MSTSKYKTFTYYLMSAAIFVSTGLFGLGFTELVLRFKNADQRNYNIEMWRYARLLKTRSEDAVLGHEHLPEKEARLQNTVIRLNSLGMRGPEPDLADKRKKRILFLGSSNTLGWGVKEEYTAPAVVARALKKEALVLNAGIGNYNTRRYVRYFETKLRSLKPDIVVVNFFANDAEVLRAGGGNWLLRHSQTAVMVNQMIQTALRGSADADGMIDYYRQLYTGGALGLMQMREALARLDQMAQEDGFRVVFVMIPDLAMNLPYPLGFINAKVRLLAEGKHGWDYVDTTEGLLSIPYKDRHAMRGDLHLSARGHKVLAETLLPHLQ